ncbi:MAG: hypothetical protein M0005_02160 [Actinomycetota bacterium]|nr:hypothetical protein [Actinomycetota bacterium]
MDTLRSGRQVEITYNDQRAIVDEMGGGIRCYEVGGRSVFDPPPPNAFASGDGLTKLGPAQSVPTAWGARLT